MSKVIENRRLNDDFLLLRVEEQNEARMGQFCMLRSWDRYPLLSRPVSVFDSDGATLSFLYRIVGEGTRLLSELRSGDECSTGSPLGHGFPPASGRVALVGGGAGIAPLYLAAKTLKRENPENIVHSYLGFTDSPILETEFGAVCDDLLLDVGGFITDTLDPAEYDCIFSCGPEIMMWVLQKKCRAVGTKHFVSLEGRMACGIGICLGCTCQASDANRKICTDGPVFPAEEVFGDD